MVDSLDQTSLCSITIKCPTQNAISFDSIFQVSNEMQMKQSHASVVGGAVGRDIGSSTLMYFPVFAQTGFCLVRA